MSLWMILRERSGAAATTSSAWSPSSVDTSSCTIAITYISRRHQSLRLQLRSESDDRKLTVATTYIILPFVDAKRGGKLLSSPRQEAKDAARAIAAAERMAGQYAGIVVLEEESDPEQDIYAEPRLPRSNGNVPAESGTVVPGSTGFAPRRVEEVLYALPT